MRSILSGYEGGLDLHQLQVLEVLLREHSLTRAARTLDVTQPALSKTLARLRRYFDDPLFVRAGLRMEPTPKAQELAAPVQAILGRVRALRSEHAAFDPASSQRVFTFCVVDAGLIKLLPPLVERLMQSAPGVRLRILQLEAQQLEPWLESGKLDFAMGAFPGLTKGVRRQPLWTERYVSVARRQHPRIGPEPTLRAFIAEKHILVSTAGSGHAHQQAERAMEAAIPPENIICRLPAFLGAAMVAKQTEAITTLPLSMATELSAELGLMLIAPPLKLPRIEIHQYWHDRFHRDAGNQWIRALFNTLFAKPR